MNNRRRFLVALLSLPAIALSGPEVLAAPPVTEAELAAAFTALPKGSREMIQGTMRSSGYYRGAIDGVWGPGMAMAFEQMMQTPVYRRAATNWTWTRDVQISETLFFLTSDAYLEEG